MTARICERHWEFCPTGVCRWCEPKAEMEVVVHIQAMDSEAVHRMLRSDAFLRAMRAAKKPLRS